ncbi:YhdP family protein [Vibrio hannami]|uniref:YhdP family protein n=1 Tax=Vibrio hannami TaxID=2717094 RepID=UPI003EBA1105
MANWMTRLGRFVLWIIVMSLVALAIAVTALRVALPRLDSFQDEIQSWVNTQTGIPFKVSSVKGYWRNTHPSLALQNLEAEFEGESEISFSVNEVQLEIDLIESIRTLRPQIAVLTGHGLELDISKYNLLGNSESAPETQADSTDTKPIIDQIEKLLFRQLRDFNLVDSHIRYQSFTGEIRKLDIENLVWSNSKNRHRLDGVVSITDSHINSLSVVADFYDHGSIYDISGDFYAEAEQIRVVPWLTKYLKNETGISSGNVSFRSWLTLEHNNPVDAYVELLPSELNWAQEQNKHTLFLEEGVFRLTPSDTEYGWKVSGHSLLARTDDEPWPEFDVAFEWEKDNWLLNISQLDISSLLPLVHLAPDSEAASEWINKLGPSGLIEDIRVSNSIANGDLLYSASLNRGGMKQWYLLPEVHELSATISGNKDKLQANLNLIDDILPFGDVFQAPMAIKQGAVDIVWERDEDGWKLWSDRVTVATPDIQAVGEFRLDFPIGASPFLSIYAEADVYNAGQTWRYLPTLALGQDLTDYLSAAIQGGKAKTAQILWHGEVNDFPYEKNEGVFQAKVGLRDARFSFLTSWPTIEDLKLDLLFENESMYLSSNQATLMNVKADKITGRIPHLGPSGHIEIEASASAKGNAVRDYMMATPLVDSVGAALTAVQVKGDVHSEFQLHIPFSSDKETRAWGYADLNKNIIDIKTPAMKLSEATGRIRFDNDAVSTSGLSAVLLDQPISVDFKGENQNRGYGVDIELVGDWDAKPLAPYLGKQWLDPIGGHALWAMDIDLQLDDVGFTYQIDTRANLEFLSSQYPNPLSKALGEKWTASMQASGNQESISARLQLPNAKYQTEIDITGNRPVLDATYLLLGKGSFKVSPVVGHQLMVRTDELNLDQWFSFLNQANGVESSAVLSQMNTPELPSPERVNIAVDSLKLASIDWNSVNFSARKKGVSWLMDINSSEVEGKATYLEPYDLSVALNRLHIFIPGLDDKSPDRPIMEADSAQPLISEFDRAFHQQMPNLTLTIDDFWLQGYKVGQANMDLQRKKDRLVWNNLEFNSGSNQVKIKGWWELTEDTSKTDLTLFVQGDDNTELMERFGISSGIQRAPFELSSNVNWQGSPWAAQIDTMNGDVSTRFGKGIISDVSGAAKLLGLFSLDSIIRRMQLDFTDVFDKGLAFNSITGTGKIDAGVFKTDDIEMDAIAGNMTIKGIADLNQQTVDAKVEFIPDLTSGIPVLTAFAVTPQTAVLVFAISTVLSPVVDVFTKVQYEVKGPLDSPVVKEVSRLTGEYKVPDSMKKKRN